MHRGRATPDVGGADEIVVGDGDDVVLGGFGGDFINVSRTTGDVLGVDEGRDVILGDNGQAEFSTATGESLLTMISTTAECSESEE